MKNRPGLRTAKDVREALGISERTWARMVAEGMPVAEPGKGKRASLVEPLKVARWILDRERLAAEEKSKVVEDLRREELRARRRANDQAEKRLLSVDQEKLLIVGLLAPIRSRLDALGRLHGQAVADAIRKLFDEGEAEWRARLEGEAGAKAVGA